MKLRVVTMIILTFGLLDSHFVPLKGDIHKLYLIKRHEKQILRWVSHLFVYTVSSSSCWPPPPPNTVSVSNK